MNRFLEEEVSSISLLPPDVWRLVFFDLHNQLRCKIYSQCTVSKMWRSYVMNGVVVLSDETIKQFGRQLRHKKDANKKEILSRWKSFLSKMANVKVIYATYTKPGAYSMKLALAKCITRKKMFANVFALHIGNISHVIDDVLKHLPLLRVLELTECEVFDAGLRQCSSNLKELTLTNCKHVTSHVFKEGCAWRTSLTSLSIECYQNEELILGVNNLINLEQFILNGDNIIVLDDIEKEPYHFSFRLPRLKTLELHDPRFSIDNTTVNALVNLTLLTLRLDGDDKIEVSGLTSLTNLQSLHIDDFCIRYSDVVFEIQHQMKNIMVTTISCYNHAHIIDRVELEYSQKKNELLSLSILRRKQFEARASLRIDRNCL